MKHNSQLREFAVAQAGLEQPQDLELALRQLFGRWPGHGKDPPGKLPVFVDLPASFSARCDIWFFRFGFIVVVDVRRVKRSWRNNQTEISDIGQAAGVPMVAAISASSLESKLDLNSMSPVS